MTHFFNKIKKITMDDLTYLFWGIYIVICFLNMVGIFYASETCQFVFKIIRYLCYIEFSAKIIIDFKNEKKITWPIIIISVLAFIITIVSKNRNILFIVLILIALRNMDFEKLIKISFKIFMTLFLVVISFAMIGILPNWEFSRGNTTRYALGFIYATDAIGMYLVTILMFFYIKKDHSTKTELLILETINVFMYSYTNGRVSFFLISFILFIQFLSRFNFAKKVFYNNYIQKVLKLVCNTLPIILFLGIHILVIMYANNSVIANKANKLLSDRIKLTYQAYRNNNANLFGNDIKWQGWGGYGYTEQEEEENFTYNFVDSSYARLVLDYGVVLSCIVICAYREVLIRNFNNKNYWLIFTIIFILIWSFIEQYIINIGKNVFVLSFIPLLQYGEIKIFKNKNIKTERDM